MLFPFVKRCNDKSIKFSATITTNGYYLDKYKIDKLYSFNVNNIQITLDGLADTYAISKGCKKDCFDTVLANIKKCNNIVPVVIRLNVSKRNTGEIQRLISYILTNIAPNVKFHIVPVHAYCNDVKNIILENEEFNSFLKSIIDWACNVGYQKNILILRPRCHTIVCDAMLGKSYVIGPNGCLYKCTHQIGYEEYSVGNVETGFVHNRTALDYVKNELPHKCIECKILPVCAGGCPFNRIYNHVDVDCIAKFSEVIEAVKAYEKVKKIT